jgi:hypothetical protein
MADEVKKKKVIPMTTRIAKMIETVCGNEVGWKEPVCVIHKAEHKDCKGCPSELGCAKMGKLQNIMRIPSLYMPKDFNDFAQMTRKINLLTKAVLDSKTVKEVEGCEII